VTNTESSKEANLHFKLSSVPALPWWLKSLTVIMVSFTCKSTKEESRQCTQLLRNHGSSAGLFDFWGP
jgi:hypothetical protein